MVSQPSCLFPAAAPHGLSSFRPRARGGFFCLFKAYDGEFGRLQTSQLIRLGGQALLLSALLMAGVLTGCGDSEAPTTDSKVPTDEPQEPMDTGPMANDGQATRESTGDGVSDPE